MAPKAPEPEPEPEAEEAPEPEEGSGAFSFEDGSKYEGAWLKKEGVTMRHGRGVYVDGDAEDQCYEGEWFEDMMQGRGTFRYASGAKYEVRMRTRRRSVRLPPKTHRSVAFSFALIAARASLCMRVVPVLTMLPDPCLRAQGEFVANKYHGYGTFAFPDGSKYEGNFKDNQMHGAGTYTDASGVEWKGKFYNGTGPGLAAGVVVAK